MTATVAILVPVLGRPASAAPLAASVAAATTIPHRLVFVASPGDVPEVAACRATGADVLLLDRDPGPGDFARKIQLGFDSTSEPFVLQAADDVVFHPRWAEEALAEIERTATGVCGTNDLANPRVRRGLHSTHSLIRRAYAAECGASLDGPGSVFSLAYSHQWVDSELVELAKARGCWSFAARSVVEHRHPIWRTARSDATYERGALAAHDDAALYRRRSARIRAGG